MKGVMVVCLWLLQAFPSTPPPILARHYQEGEPVVYRMHGINRGPERAIRYDAQADGLVKKNDQQIFFEEFAWSAVRVNDQPLALSAASQQFRQDLSLAPGFKLSIPPLNQVEPILIGPVTDLLTFYADVQLAMRQKLLHAGDHVLVPYGKPNSWADGKQTLLGQDVIDFDITLKTIDHKSHVASLIIRHVPPANPQIKLPAPWMQPPVSSGSANNWVQVQKSSAGKFLAQIGSETFLADIKIFLPEGRILSASMQNPVAVMQRVCDEALAVCEAPTRFTIEREIKIDGHLGLSRNP